MPESDRNQPLHRPAVRLLVELLRQVMVRVCIQSDRNQPLHRPAMRLLVELLRQIMVRVCIVTLSRIVISHYIARP